MNESLSKDVIFAAADAIADREGTATLVDLAAELGVADKAALLPAMQEWRIKRALALGTGDDLWSMIAGSLAPLTNEVRALLHDVEMQADRRAASGIEAVELRAAETRDEYEAMVAERAAEARILKEMLSETQAANETAEQHIQQYAGFQEMLETISIELQNARAHEEELEAQLGNLERQLAVAEAGRAEASGERDRVRDDLAALMESRLLAESKVEGMRDLLRTIEQENQALRAQVDRNRTLAASGISSDAADDWLMGDMNLPELPRQLAVAMSRISALKAERDALRGQLDESRVQLARFQKIIEMRMSAPPAVVAAPAPAPAAPAPVAPSPAPAPVAAQPAPSNVTPLRAGGSIEIVRRKG